MSSTGFTLSAGYLHSVCLINLCNNSALLRVEPFPAGLSGWEIFPEPELLAIFRMLVCIFHEFLLP